MPEEGKTIEIAKGDQFSDGKKTWMVNSFDPSDDSFDMECSDSDDWNDGTYISGDLLRAIKAGTLTYKAAS